ncbi:hypothetical protein M8J75_005314 [Diaphorina citri]|nr:hypothetical protein M8J75_005314 [Diaphorina citri]KAI5738480.1 hypothetical protein M8J77_007646 [Diaphorina citri]
MHILSYFNYLKLISKTAKIADSKNSVKENRKKEHNAKSRWTQQNHFNLSQSRPDSLKTDNLSEDEHSNKLAQGNVKITQSQSLDKCLCNTNDTKVNASLKTGKKYENALLQVCKNLYQTERSSDANCVKEFTDKSTSMYDLLRKADKLVQTEMGAELLIRNNHPCEFPPPFPPCLEKKHATKGTNLKIQNNPCPVSSCVNHSCVSSILKLNPTQKDNNINTIAAHQATIKTPKNNKNSTGDDASYKNVDKTTTKPVQRGSDYICEREYPTNIEPEVIDTMNDETEHIVRNIDEIVQLELSEDQDNGYEDKFYSYFNDMQNYVQTYFIPSETRILEPSILASMSTVTSNVIMLS